MGEVRGVAPGAAGRDERITPLEWLLLGVGLIGLIAALVGYVGGSGVHRETLQPLSLEEGDVTRYRSSAARLEPGDYMLRLSLPGVRPPGLGLTGIRLDVAYECSSPQLPGWREGGHLSGSSRRRDRRSTSRRRVYDRLVLAIERPNDYVFDVALDRPLDERLDISIRRTLFDYRPPLVLGVALVGLALVTSRGVRRLVRELLDRRSA